MRIILDANEYIFGLDDLSGKVWPLRLLSMLPFLIDNVEGFVLYVPEIIRKEVQRNLAPDLIGDFYRLVKGSDRIVYGSLFNVLPSLHGKYLELGLKQADAAIAAFAQHVGADLLISENRHIYHDLSVDEFVTCDAETFLRLLESGEVWRILQERKGR